MFKKFLICFVFALISIGFVNVKADINDYSGNINPSGTFLSDYPNGLNFTRSDIMPLLNNMGYNGCMLVPNSGKYAIVPLNFPSTMYFGNSSYQDFNISGQYLIFNYPNSSAGTLKFYRYVADSNTGIPILHQWTSSNWSFTNTVTNNGVTYYRHSSDTGLLFFLPDSTVIYYNNRLLVDYNVTSNHKWENIIIGYDYNLNPTDTLFGATTFVDGVISWNFKPYVDGVLNYDPDNYDYYFQFAINVPTSGFIDAKWASDGLVNSELSSVMMQALLNMEKENGENIVYNGYGNIYSGDLYTTIFATVKVSDITSSFDSEECIVSCIYTDWTWDSQLLGGLNFRNNGIFDYLFNLYGSRDKALFALNYINLNYCNCYCYEKATYSICNPTVIYYFDQKLSNGTILDRRNLIGKTDITPDNITDPGENDVTIDDDPVISIPENVIKDTLNQSINNSYNNIVNNYYYNNNLTDNILDYYNRFSDGGTNEDIESALGYVKSTLGSLTHIPLLLGYCFTGFFPPEVLNLLYALLIIFVVFLIIRIIKHLFTH